MPPELLDQIEAVYCLIGKYLDKNLEQFEIGFMREMMPEIQVAIWCSIAAAWSSYHEKFLGGIPLPDELEKKLVAALVTISTGEQDMRNLCVSAPVGTRLLACFCDQSSSGS